MRVYKRTHVYSFALSKASLFMSLKCIWPSHEWRKTDIHTQKTTLENATEDKIEIQK